MERRSRAKTIWETQRVQGGTGGAKEARITAITIIRRMFVQQDNTCTVNTHITNWFGYSCDIQVAVVFSSLLTAAPIHWGRPWRCPAVSHML